MTALALALVGFVAVALGIIGFVAFPHRGRPVPGAPRLSERVERAAARVPLADPDPTYGVLSSPERDLRARERFERAENRILGVIGKRTHTGGGSHARTERAPRQL